MPAPKGNQFWKARTKHGRDKIFSSAESLWDACCEYFQWVEDNPLWEVKVGWFQGVATQEKVPKLRAMTLDGLSYFLNISMDTWRNWKKDKDFLEVVARAESVIREQKFAGAAAELLNPNIIARDLGISDKKEHDHKSSDGSMSPDKMSDSELDARISVLLRDSASESES